MYEPKVRSLGAFIGADEADRPRPAKTGTNHFYARVLRLWSVKKKRGGTGAEKKNGELSRRNESGERGAEKLKLLSSGCGTVT